MNLEETWYKTQQQCLELLRGFVDLIDYLNQPKAPKDADEVIEGKIDDLIDHFNDEYEFVCLVAALLQTSTGMDKLRHLLELAEANQGTSLGDALATLATKEEGP